MERSTAFGVFWRCQLDKLIEQMMTIELNEFQFSCVPSL